MAVEVATHVGVAALAEIVDAIASRRVVVAPTEDAPRVDPPLGSPASSVVGMATPSYVVSSALMLRTLVLKPRSQRHVQLLHTELVPIGLWTTVPLITSLVTLRS